MTAPAEPLNTNKSTALEMEDVTVPSLRNPAEAVLEAVNWRVAAGEFWAVAGLLRFGESELMALAAGILRPGRGPYRLFGKEHISGFEQELLSLRPLGLLVF